MDYNKILRDASATLPEKEKAFTFFIQTYRKEGWRFILTKIQKFIPQLPEKDVEAEDLYQEAACILFEKIKKGDLCDENHTTEAWLNQLAIGLIANKSRKETARPKQNENYAENEEKTPKQPRFIDFDLLKIKIFGTDDKIQQDENTAQLREQLDIFIKKGSKTCQQLFNEFLLDGDMFEWWKNYRAADKDLTNAKELAKVRSNFDATFSTCRKSIRDLAPWLRNVLYK